MDVGIFYTTYVPKVSSQKTRELMGFLVTVIFFYGLILIINISAFDQEKLAWMPVFPYTSSLVTLIAC